MDTDAAKGSAHSLDAIPIPWNYNPSSWKERVRISLFAGLAFLMAAYMALYQWQLIDDVWDPVFGDQTKQVLRSDVSEKLERWFLIPDAALGALAYLGDVIFCLAGSTRRWQYRPWLVLLFGFYIIPLGIVGVVLVSLQGTVVGAWCFLCLGTAAISLLLIYLGYDEVWSCLLYLYRVWRKTRSLRILWNTLWGRASREAEEVGIEMCRRT